MSDSSLYAKHHLTHAPDLYYGGAYDPVLFNFNARKGVHITPITQASLGSPVAASATGLVNAATGAQLPNATTLTFSPGSNTAAIPASALNAGSAVVQVWALDVPRNVSITVAHASSVVGLVATVRGFDAYLQPMTEILTVVAGGTSQTVAGNKAFAYIASIALTASGNAATDTVNVGWGDVLGLPYLIGGKADVMQVWFNEALETTAPVTVVGDPSVATATTGDVRGTVALHSACNGSPVTVYMVTYPATRQTLLGVDNF